MNYKTFFVPLCLDTKTLFYGIFHYHCTYMIERALRHVRDFRNFGP